MNKANPKQVRVGEERSYTILKPAPRFDQHTIDILSELGYCEKETVELLRIGAVHEYLADLGNKNAYFLGDKKCSADR